MHDPLEGVGADGSIRTGVDRRRVPTAFEPVVAALLEAVPQRWGGSPVSLLLYGSVATGTARVGASDVDAVTVGLPAAEADAISVRLSERFAGLGRGVQIGAAQPQDHTGDDDEPYGNRVFLRHHCLRLAGLDVAAGWGPFPADARAARGFNGDVAQHLERWRDALADGPAAALQRRVARKTLFAVAGLVSVHDRTWTTDRLGAAHRWAQLHPGEAGGLAQLAAWSQQPPAAPVQPGALPRALDEDGVVARVVDAFRHDVGLWRSAS